jgi:hypothetical protein
MTARVSRVKGKWADSQEGKIKESGYKEGEGRHVSDASVAAELVLYSREGRLYRGDQRDTKIRHGLVGEAWITEIIPGFSLLL